MSARSRGHSVGKLVQRFESAAPGTAKIRSQPKSHPLAFIFARWWRAVQPHEKLHLPKADVADSRSVRSTVSPSWKGEAAEEPHLSSTGTPSQDSGSRPSSSSRGEEALVTAARRFLAEHRASGSSALSAIAIRLDADSDDESEEKGARDVLAAAKLYAHLQHLSGSLPDAFCASLGELWTSPPQEMQPASWRPSQDSMALSETAKEDWRSISAAAELESAHEVIKDQRELLQLEQLHREELEKKILDLEDTIKSKQKQAAEEQLRGDELEEKLQDQRDFLQLEQIQRAELEKKILDLEEVIKSTQKRKEEEQLRRDDLENKLQDRIEELQKKIGDMEELIKSKQKRKEEEQLRREEADNKLQDQREELKQKIRDLEDSIKSKQKRNEEEQLRRDEKERELQEALRQEQMKCQGLEVEVESLVSQLGQCSEEMSELQRCRDELTAVLQERQALLDALAENEALLVELEDASDVSAADALRQAAAALTELRRRLASSEAQKRQLERQCEKLEAQTEEDFQSLQRHRERAWEQAELEDPIRTAWNAGKLRSGLPSDLQESINLPNEVLSAADLAAHLRGGLQTSHTQGAHCRALVERVNALQKERDAMASEVREALALCGRAARAAREARR